VPIDRHAHAIRGDGAVAQSLKGTAQMGFHDPVHHQQREHQQERDDPEVFGLAEHMPEDGGLGHADAHGTFGQERHLVDQDLDNRAECQGHHGQIRAGDTQCRQRQHGTKPCCHHDGHGQGEVERHLKVKHHHARHIGPDAEQPRMPQRHLPRIAHHDVQAKQQNGIDHDGFDQMLVIAIGHCQGKQRKTQNGQPAKKPGSLLHRQTFLIAVLPNRPAGLNVSTSNNSTNPGTSLYPVDR